MDGGPNYPLLFFAMGIYQENIKGLKSSNQIRFDDLKHIPYIEIPDNIDGINETWYLKQKESIEARIKKYEAIDNGGDCERTISALRERIETLRIFTDNVTKTRSRDKRPMFVGNNHSVTYKEKYDDIARADNHIEKLIKLKEEDERHRLDMEYFLNR